MHSFHENVLPRFSFLFDFASIVPQGIEGPANPTVVGVAHMVDSSCPDLVNCFCSLIRVQESLFGFMVILCHEGFWRSDISDFILCTLMAIVYLCDVCSEERSLSCTVST